MSSWRCSHSLDLIYNLDCFYMIFVDEIEIEGRKGFWVKGTMENETILYLEVFETEEEAEVFLDSLLP